jgi:hypothetical protein
VTILEKNLKKFPWLANPKLYQAAPGPYELVPARQGDFTIKYQGKNLLSAYNPLRECERLVQNRLQQTKKKARIFICLGLAGGHLVQTLQAQVAQARIAVWEPNHSLLKLILSKVDLSAAKDLFIFSKADDLVAWFRNQQQLISGYQEISVQALTERYPEPFSQIRQTLSQIFNRLISGRLTHTTLGEKWLLNILSNLRFLPQSLDLAQLWQQGVFSEVVMVGAGPSLVKKIPFLKKCQGHLPIIAVDSAVFVLNKFGIVPDFIYLLDSQYFNFHHLKFCDNLNCYLIADISATKYVLQKYHQRFKGVFFTKTIKPVNDHLVDVIPFTQYLQNKYQIHLPGIQSGGSVATSVFDFLRQAGVQKIWQLGMEHQYHDCLSHARGSAYEKFHLLNATRLNSYLNNNYQFLKNRQIKCLNSKERLYTDFTLSMYNNWFKEAFAMTGIRCQKPNSQSSPSTSVSLKAPPLKATSISPSTVKKIYDDIIYQCQNFSNALPDHQQVFAYYLEKAALIPDPQAAQSWLQNSLKTAKNHIRQLCTFYTTVI